MTLTELRYVVAVARERHFGRAAGACHVSQPTLSVAIRKLEEELGVRLFERRASQVALTDIGERIVTQAKRVLDEASAVREIARQGRDPLAAPLRVGTIYTIGPYLLPGLIRQLQKKASQMQLLLSENFTVKLIEQVRNGEIDVAIMASPLPACGLSVQAVYDEPFVVAVPRRHSWTRRKAIASDDLEHETMLLLGNGHCFRDQVLDVCPERSREAGSPDGIQRTFEGSSLETIRQMVATGIGITVMPRTSMPARISRQSLVAYLPFKNPPPHRRVVLAWRRSFTRTEAVESLRQAILDCPLEGVEKLDAPVEAA
jgi:LysR family transcriptional regulator, hydrogen peroxide-inducible genes activator